MTDSSLPDLSGARPSVDQAQSMAHDMIDAGHDPADISAMFQKDYGIPLSRRSAAPPALGGGNPAGSVAPGTPSGDAPAGGSTLTPAQAAAEIANLKRDDGFLQRLAEGEAAAFNEWRRLHQAAFPEDGPMISLETQKHITVVEAVGGTVDPVEIDRRTSQIEWGNIGADNPNALDIKQTIGRELVKLGMDPRTEASSFIALVSEADSKISQMNPDQVEIHVEGERNRLRGLWGSEYESRVADINKFIGKLPDHVQDWLDSSNALRDAMSVNAIYGRIMRGRQGLLDLKNKRAG